MGGDLPFFLECIRNRQKKSLTEYAHLCIDAIYNIYNAFGLPAITIALVEGNAYGGGFECALAHDFIVAEESAQFCLPENKFNLFPGMGAHSVLNRKIGAVDTNALIRNSRIYKSRYLQSLGLVEEITERNRSMLALIKLARRIKDRFNFELHHIRCTKIVHSLPKKELLNITDIWVDTCMKVSDFDLRKMEILATAQSRKVKASAKV